MTSSQSCLDRYLDIVLALTQKELRVRYKNYALGYLWSLAQPLAFAAVFFFAFKVVLRVPIENFVFFLLAGLFPWQWFANSVNMSPMFFLNNASIIKKVAFPRHAVVVSCVLQDAIHFLLSIPVIAGVALFYGKPPSAVWLVGVPVLVAFQMVFIVGTGLILGSVNMFFRDLERLTILSMMLLFYFTPIVYSDAQIPARFRPYLFLNPAVGFIVGWRELFMEGRLDPHALGWIFLHTAVVLTIGTLLYRRLAPRFAEAI